MTTTVDPRSITTLHPPPPDDWPDPADLTRGLLAALAGDDAPAASDLAGELIVAVDRAVGRQLAVVLDHPSVAAVEAAWRGLALVLDAPADVLVADAVAAELADAGWLDRLLFAGPIDTRGGRPVSLLVTPSPAAVPDRAVCPVVTDGPTTPLRPPRSADPDWATWFADDPAGPLLARGGHAVAAAAARSTAAHGWPVDVPTTDAVARQLVAARFAQMAAVWCRDHRPADASPAGLARLVVDALRGRFVGPRLPLRRADVTVAADGAITLALAPRLGGDDPGDATVTVVVPGSPR